MNAVDTNVLIHACDARDPGVMNRAREVMAGLEDGVLLWRVACEFVAASRKLAGQGFAPSAAWTQLEALREAWPLALPSSEVLQRAKMLHTGNQVSFWDAMLYGACIDAGVKRLYSEDISGAPIPGLEIVNPFA